MVESRHVGRALHTVGVASGRTDLYPCGECTRCRHNLRRGCGRFEGSWHRALRTLSPRCRAGIAAAAGGIGRRLSPRLAHRATFRFTFGVPFGWGAAMTTTEATASVATTIAATIPMHHGLLLAAILFALGMVGILVR